jgi:hypothetical protein
VGENNITGAAIRMIEVYCMVSIESLEIENLRRGIERRNFLCTGGERYPHTLLRRR